MTIEELAGVILEQTRQVLRAKGYDSQVETEAVEVRPGPKYTKINRGPRWGQGRTEHNMPGFLMIDNATGEIYGIKGYGVVHKGHRYGTLATAHEWYWGEYGPRKIRGGVPSADDAELHRRNLAGDMQES
jgi:hypothetical protein